MYSCGYDKGIFNKPLLIRPQPMIKRLCFFIEVMKTPEQLTEVMEIKFNIDDFSSFSSRVNQFQGNESENKLKAAKAIIYFNLEEDKVINEINELKNKLESLQSKKVRLNQSIVGIEEHVSFNYPVAIVIDKTTYVFEKDLNVKAINEVF